MKYKEYLKKIKTIFETDKATEHSYRPALQSLLQSLTGNIQAINELNRVECGAPDFEIQRDSITIGNVECKDINISLVKEEKSEQLKRYREALPNLILTDYLEFRWYLDGELRLNARLGSVVDGKIKPDTDGMEAVNALLQEFIDTDAPGIGTTEQLAFRMARAAQLIRDAIISALNMEDRGGSLHQQMEDFRTTLVHDINAEKFADMYAETICYGLFTARIEHQSGIFTREKAPHLLPKSNPFLRKMFDHIAGIDLDSRITWIVDNLAETFHRADMHAILTEFKKRTSGKDAVLHFYEDFLSIYDPKKRKDLGVYYTPEPVVSYIVRSVDKILKKDFNLKDGLMDATKIDIEGRKGETDSVHKVQILDPAVGTGSFLHGVVDHIHQSFIGNEGMWQGYVDNDLLPRLYGFELLMAPYTIAHLKIGMQLKETDYQFNDKQRLKIYLTNSLEESNKQLQQTWKFGFSNWLIEEAVEAGDIKADKPVMVVLGNPPYKGESQNKGQWITKLHKSYFIVDGQPLKERNSKWVNNDYAKFIRFSQWRIEQTGYGVLAFITSHSYLDSRTFRGMRQSLMSTFDDIYLLDLHGNVKKKEKCPDGSKDEGVFNIEEGTVIGLFIRRNSPTAIAGGNIGGVATIHHADLRGLRKDKFGWLAGNDVESTKWEKLKPVSKLYYNFMPIDMTRWEEYELGWKVNEIIPFNRVGMVTARDKFTIRLNADEVWTTVKKFTMLMPEKARDKYELGKDVRDWKVEWAQMDLKRSPLSKWKIFPIFYRPFDIRYTYYTGNSRGFHCYPRSSLMRHMLPGDNLGLLVSSQLATKGFQHIFCTDRIIESSAVSNKTKEITSVLPLYLYPEDEPRRPNLSPEYLAELSAKIAFDPAPEQVFHYIYGLFHSPTYRIRFAEFLKMDFPRVLMPPDGELFKALGLLGEQLVGYHLMERKGPDFIKYPVAGENMVTGVRYSVQDQRVWINKKQYFEPAPPKVWEFHIGGYQVCKKWLSDRKGRELSYDDIQHYGQVVSALSETIRLMGEIDTLTVKAFGW